jgi:hypothetical protein
MLLTDFSIAFLTSLVVFEGVLLVNFGMVYFGIAFFRRISAI